MSFQIKQNDTTPSLRASLLNGNGDAVDLINTTVKFHMRPIGSSTPSIDAVASVISEPLGVVQYDWLAFEAYDSDVSFFLILKGSQRVEVYVPFLAVGRKKSNAIKNASVSCRRLSAPEDRSWPKTHEF